MIVSTALLIAVLHCVHNYRWYRGLIREKTESQCEVFFIDHGDTEWVENQLVEPIDHTLLEVL